MAASEAPFKHKLLFRERFRVLTPMITFVAMYVLLKIFIFGDFLISLCGIPPILLDFIPHLPSCIPSPDALRGYVEIQARSFIPTESTMSANQNDQRKKKYYK